LPKSVKTKLCELGNNYQTDRQVESLQTALQYNIEIMRERRCNMLRKIDGLMTHEGFEKLQNNTADLYLARYGNDSDQVAILTAERKAICDDDKNYVHEEVAE
jgi:hypothetical protein